MDKICFWYRNLNVVLASNNELEYIERDVPSRTWRNLFWGPGWLVEECPGQPGHLTRSRSATGYKTPLAGSRMAREAAAAAPLLWAGGEFDLVVCSRSLEVATRRCSCCTSTSSRRARSGCLLHHKSYWCGVLAAQVHCRWLRHRQLHRSWCCVDVLLLGHVLPQAATDRVWRYGIWRCEESGIIIVRMQVHLRRQ